ncbi:MAG: D-glycerate dehydrogenase [Chloroflexi bacterium]|nr:D-glycerate dehydrogenase [Chloroflexota bacterium]|tara:strand:+ start:2084 stop:3064 length:981 start_codon:yes stop_codon:yes gene_type:complete
MSKPKVLVTRKIFPEWIDYISKNAELDLWEDELPPPRDILLNKVKGVDGILCLLTDKIDPELMDIAGSQLKVISQIAVGFDNINIDEATKRKIPVGNTPDVLTSTTADATWSLLMSIARRISESERFVHNNKWKTWHPLHFLGQDIYNSTLGIIGMGRIGYEVAKRAIGFDCKILYYDVNRRLDLEEKLPMQYVDLNTLLKESDIVSLHTVLNDDTYHLIGENELKLMKNNSILVNVSRGPVVDTKALYRALKDKIIWAAALDVTDPEPILKDDPLLQLDNCLIVPHIASASYKTRYEMSRISAQNLINGINKKTLLTCINPEVNY